MSCNVQPAVVDLSSGAQDVDVTVTMAAKSKRIAAQTSLRTSRLQANDPTPQSRSVNVTVTANVGGAIRTISVPVAVEQ
jgi:hypothetical protein